MIFIFSCYILYMTQFFPRNWADGSSSIELIRNFSSIIPALRKAKNSELYTNYWGGVM